MRIVLNHARASIAAPLMGAAMVIGGHVSQAEEPVKVAELAGKKYTATASLLIERRQPHILRGAAEKDDPGEFECFRATQMQLLKSPFVLMAALREPKVKYLPGVVREDGRHRVLAWLGKAICVGCPERTAGVVTVSFTDSDPQEAAALVNAVVNAYLNEVVNYDRQLRRVKLSELQQISAEKETKFAPSANS